MDASVSFYHRQNFAPFSKDKKAMPFQEFTRGLSHFGLRASLRRRLGRHNTLTPSRPLILTKTLAVSDGELNALEPLKRTDNQCSNSNSSLPSVPSGGASGVGRVASWAVSFERLLEDPLGVYYFTEFLKSEVSVENINFWVACEHFRKIPANNTEKLIKEALSIYNSYLSKCASNPINIDDKGRVDEQDIQKPHPDMFEKAQQQIFKLMKFDSYTRFVRSQLYQNCMLANVEGRSLPELGHCAKLPLAARHSSPGTRELQKSKEKAKVKIGKIAGGETEDVVERRKITLQGKMNWEKRKEKRGSWGESQMTGRPGSFHCAEVERLVARSTDSASDSKTTADKYCCVFLPDGTASLTPARHGITIRRMLTGLCEKRGLPLSEIIIYLQGKDKQPLSLDQDSSVLKDQQVLLELRVTFALEVAFTGKSVAMVVKSNKTLQEVLTSLLQKHRLRPQDVFVTMKGSQELINMNTIVTNLANKTLILDKVQGMDQGLGSNTTAISSLQGRRGAVDVDPSSLNTLYRSNPKQKNPSLRRAYDMEGLVELLNRAQGCSADDQRGLLKKEELILPDFLQVEERDEEEERQEEQRSTSPQGFISPDPTSCTEGDVVNSSKSSLCSTEPVDRMGSKKHSNPARETVV
ncbi:regulator of G-protein signaling 14 isoform X1 [Silurus meridionalis]|uniref:regulator of G-protein signaling 14 isoform X1 n=1 Tax=Silurus meridionalis TaxID=175797 RepID=UPI001EEB6254|nr:regulator of G-protein signaling 14 isoform X1 [Silurus meridionalis]XP_046723765.1 regulator of G-protein signaling 14 isoform X1 [Silurus meridionalis]